MDSALDTLEIDRYYRENYEAVKPTSDLFTLSDINSHPDWNASLPTLTSKKWGINDLNIKTPILEFNKKYSFFKRIDMSNLLIAGGSIGKILLNSNRGNVQDNDVDIFMYGIRNVTDATKRISKFLNELFALKKENSEERKSVRRSSCKRKSKSRKSKSAPRKKKEKEEVELNIMIRNRNCLTVNLNKVKIQIIFRLYKSISEILHGFDLGSSSVGYDYSTDNIYFTSLSKFSYTHMCNIVDTTRRSTTYESRLYKYYNRGFDIILPNLNINSLRTSYFKYNIPEVCELAHMQFKYNDIKDNRIYVDEFLNKHNFEMNVSDYADDCDEEVYPIMYSNVIKCITKCDVDDFIFYSKDRNDSILINTHVMPVSFIQKFMDRMGKNSFVKGGKLNFKTIRTYLKCHDYSNLLNEFINLDLSDKSNKMTCNGKYKQGPIREFIDKKINEQIEESTKWLSHIKSELEQREVLIPFITENPTSQLTSSINPIIEDPIEWYSKTHYIKLQYVPLLNLEFLHKDEIIDESETEESEVTEETESTEEETEESESSYSSPLGLPPKRNEIKLLRKVKSRR